jgi:hypothetical protein
MAGNTSKTSAKVARKATAKRAAAKPALLAGGNPQIAKADGDAPVQAYIAAMPGWKRDVGRRLDALIVRTVPDVRKAVKWNSPFSTKKWSRLCVRAMSSSGFRLERPRNESRRE